MISTIQTLKERALKIPSNDVKGDADCLRSLLGYGKIYFDFCFSRFQLLSQHQETLKVISEIIESCPASNKNIFVPFLNLFLSKSNPQNSAQFLYKLLQTDKAPIVSSIILIYPNTTSYIEELCTLLFNSFPDPSTLNIRDNLLFRYIGFGKSTNFVIQCLSKIPTNINPSFYQEFLLFFSYLTQNNCTNKKLLSLAIEVCITRSSPQTLISLILQSKFDLPQTFVEWIQQNVKEEYEIPKERIKDVPIEELPPLLRVHRLMSGVSGMNTPRFCRKMKQSKGMLQEFIKRVNSENDPKLLHDLLISDPQAIYIKDNIPIKFTLLALRAINEPNFSNLFISQFSKLTPGTDEAVIEAAAHGLYLLSERNQSVTLRLFPKIRNILTHLSSDTSPTYYYLMLSIKNAVLAESLHSGFIWRDYHSILTATQNEFELPDIIHYCIVALNKPRSMHHEDFDLLYNEIQKTSEEILLAIAEKDKPAVEKAVLQIMPEVLEKHPQLARLRPEIYMKPNPKTDTLPLYVSKELQKTKTVSRMLLIATAFGAHPDAFTNQINDSQGFHPPEWASPIITAGNDVFNMKLTIKYQDLCSKMTDSNQSNETRFGCAFALSMYISHQLIQPSIICPTLLSSIKNDKSPLVRLICFYGLSMCRLQNPMQFINEISNKKETEDEDIIGLSYCITRWLPQLPQLSQTISDLYKRFKNRPFVWSHFAEAMHFIYNDTFQLNLYEIRGLGEYFHMISHEDSSDEYAIIIQNAKELTWEEVSTAILGYIPYLAFSQTPLILNPREENILNAATKVSEQPNIIQKQSGQPMTIEEQQKAIQEAIAREQKKKDEKFGLLKAIISRPRRAQNAPQINKDSLPATEDIQKNYKIFTKDELYLRVIQLSDFQKQELYSKNQEYSILIANIEKNIKEAGRLIAIKIWPTDILIQVAKSFNTMIPELLISILQASKDVTYAAHFLAIANFNEEISVEAAIILLPWLLTNIDFDDSILLELSKKQVKMDEISHALILTKSFVFENHQENYKYFVEN